MILKAIGEISSVDFILTWRSDRSSRKVDKEIGEWDPNR